MVWLVLCIYSCILRARSDQGDDVYINSDKERQLNRIFRGGQEMRICPDGGVWYGAYFLCSGMFSHIW